MSLTLGTRKIMVIAGESSGDRIAAPALKAARRLADSQDIELSIFGIGGDEMKGEGVKLYHTVREMSVIGFVEVARRFRFFRSVLMEMTRMLDEQKPDVLLLIDYPGFNIRLAREAKKRKIPVVYYVSPQVWAWHASRVQELRSVVDRMLVIFPFEEKIYRDQGMVGAEFVGHPLVERIDDEKAGFTTREVFAARYGLDPLKEWLLVFAGSRTEEVRRLLPQMSEAAVLFAAKYNFEAILVESINIDRTAYTHFLRGPLTRFRESKAAHELMYHSDLGLLKSGTTTLEAALLELPGAICYRTHPLTFAIGKRLVKLPYIGLANIVIGRKLYPELLQNEVNPESLVSALESVNADRKQFQTALQGLATTLRRGPESPSERVAKVLLEC